MEQSLAVWLLIGLSLITANLPFLVQSPLLVLPWKQASAPRRSWLVRWLESLVFFSVLVGVYWLAYDAIGSALVLSGEFASLAGYYGLLLAYVGVLALVFGYPAWRSRGQLVHKSFFVRLLELFMLYISVGVLAFALEVNLGNRFTQTWEFYAITASLYLVLAYPGFVIRYLLRRPRPAARGPATKTRPKEAANAASKTAAHATAVSNKTQVSS